MPFQMRSPFISPTSSVQFVPVQLAKKYCKDIVEAVRDLERLRDMTFGEIKLTVAIDPRREQQILGPEVIFNTPLHIMIQQMHCKE